MTGFFSDISIRIREADCVSESEQWTTTSWADHSPGFGRHWSASLGTVASAARRRRGPSAYWSISLARSFDVSAMGNLLGIRVSCLLKRRGEVGLAHQVE